MKKNPFVGKAYFNEFGDLFLNNKIKFGGQLNPPLKVREWLFLVWMATKESRIKYKLDLKFKGDEKVWVGSPTTEWRTRTQLIKKGYSCD